MKKVAKNEMANIAKSGNENNVRHEQAVWHVKNGGRRQ